MGLWRAVAYLGGVKWAGDDLPGLRPFVCRALSSVSIPKQGFLKKKRRRGGGAALNRDFKLATVVAGVY